MALSHWSVRRALLIAVSLPALVVGSAALPRDAPLPCATTVGIDTSLYPAVAWVDCAQNSCTTGCYSFEESTDYGPGITCSCSSTNPPRCCHLVLVPYQGGWIVESIGRCSEQMPSCQTGSACFAETLIDDGVFISEATCLGET